MYITLFIMSIINKHKRKICIHSLNIYSVSTMVKKLLGPRPKESQETTPQVMAYSLHFKTEIFNFKALTFNKLTMPPGHGRLYFTKMFLTVSSIHSGLLGRELAIPLSTVGVQFYVLNLDGSHNCSDHRIWQKSDCASSECSS